MPRETWHAMWAMTRKEVAGFFASPAAFLFLGAFLGVTLFVFFWVETFFSRNLADVRPLFQWMPLLLIFLVAALTMRSWAEERRGGTLELLMTAPVSPTRLVLAKFAGAMALVAIALALTLPLPISVALLGPLDWGPVFGGYVAALALASSYVAIGLWVSSRTDNQIVSLIVTVAIAGAFYLIGSPALTALVGHRGAELLRELGAGSRFVSIERGVLDLRDLYYYVSITLAFLALNRWELQRIAWAGNALNPTHRRWGWATGLAVANLLAANAWLHHLSGARADLTAGRVYSLSEPTRNYLRQLREPLLIRGYFSASTHPLLAPLVPRLRDLLAEYAVAGGANVRIEIVDPQTDTKLEEEAAGRYGIRPVPFQVASKYQASVVNSYFDILVSYGDQYQVLSFRDLIDVKSRGEGEFDVALRNPEYDLTRTVRKVLASYQGGASPFATLTTPLTFTGYLSSGAALPQNLAPARAALEQALDKLRAQAGTKLKVEFKDPGADPALAKRLAGDEGLRPLVAGLLDPRPFWFHLALSDGKQQQRVPLPQPLDQDGFKRSLEAAIKRFSPGFLKSVAVLSSGAPEGAMPGQFPGAGAQHGNLREALGQSVSWLDADLRDGQVPATADMLLVLGPENLDEKRVFAIDQFLMQGGSVVIATAPTAVTLSRSIDARAVQSGLEVWLGGHGVSVDKGLVLDPQSGALPIPVERPIGGGLSVREIQLAPYPYIVDVRGAGLDASNPVTASLGQLAVPWAAPVSADAEKNKARKVTTLLRSSAQSWVSESLDLLPDYRRYRDLGFAPGDKRAANTLALMIEGRFESAFKGKDSPLLQSADAKADGGKPASAALAAATAAAKGEKAAPAPGSAASAPIGRVIDHSPDSARLVVVGSAALFGDQAANLIGQAMGSRYLKPAEFAQNLVDWSLEDQGLLTIRSRGTFARTLAPLSAQSQAFWEYANYVLALIGLGVVWAVQRWRRGLEVRRHHLLLQEV